jgi:hypothetical protein
MAAAALGQALDTMVAHPLALQARNLQTLAELGVEKNTTVVFPASMMSAIAEISSLLTRETTAAQRITAPLTTAKPHALSTNDKATAAGDLRQLEDVLALLIGAGFTGADALGAYRALFGFLYGHVLTELQEIVERPDEIDHVLRLGLFRLPIGEFPHLRNLAPTDVTVMLPHSNLPSMSVGQKGRTPPHLKLRETSMARADVAEYAHLRNTDRTRSWPDHVRLSQIICARHFEPWSCELRD